MSKEILLVNPPDDIITYRPPVQPLGIASIAAYLEENGYSDQVELIDGYLLCQRGGVKPAIEKIVDKIKKDRPSIVGYSTNLSNFYVVENFLKSTARLGVKTIVGGYGSTSYPKEYAELKNVATVVRGEGEATSKELIDALLNDEDLYDIDGITYSDGKKTVTNRNRNFVDLNEIPPPAMNLLPHPKRYGYVSIIEESRGCCFNCSFCSISNMYHKPNQPPYRLKTAENIGMEVERAHDQGINKILFIGELILLNKERALNIAEKMEEFNFSWKISAHPQLIVKQKRILPILNKKGLYAIETGIESASQHSLDVFNKQTTPKQNKKAIKALLSAKITPHLDFITFNPFMTMEDLGKNIVFILENLRAFTKSPNYPGDIFNSLSALQGTPIKERMEKEGLIIKKKLDKKNTIVYIEYKDKDVSKVLDSAVYFMQTYGEHYRKLLKELPLKKFRHIASNVLAKSFQLAVHDASSQDIENAIDLYWSETIKGNVLQN